MYRGPFDCQLQHHACLVFTVPSAKAVHRPVWRAADMMRRALGLKVLLLLSLVAAHSAAAQPATSPLPADTFSPRCGSEGMVVCADICVIKDLPHPDWCPSSLGDNGCLKGLTRVSITPGAANSDPQPDICFNMPKEGEACGRAGTPCCLAPKFENPSTLVRPMCAAGLSCIVADPLVSLPYGGSKHMQAVLSHPGSQGLLSVQVMGTCKDLASATAPGPTTAAVGESNGSQGFNSVLGECGLGRMRCPQGTYCASNEDHLLGGARCVPMPTCGGAYQQCCPPYSNGEPPVLSIVDKHAAVPVCNDPDAVCVWKSALEGFDPSQDSVAVPLLTPPGSTSIALQYPHTLCIPNLTKCGKAGEACCPHAQFANSNDPLYFRLHVCDPGLRCQGTISLFKGQSDTAVLGTCQGEATQCGALDEQCCNTTDAAGWEWRTCGSGEPGLFCAPDNTCKRCPSTTDEAGMNQASLAALSRPGLGNAC